MPHSARARVPRHLAAHGRHQLEAGGLQRRHEPEERRGYDGAGHQEHQYAPVGGGSSNVQQTRKLADLRRDRCQHGIQHTFQKQPRCHKSASRRREREQKALSQQLPDDAPA
jgi:hypothetical protein